jgi:nitrogen fixation/metabolism regulation signal transduction histidine kinase
MAEIADKAKEVAHAVEHAVEHPIETAKALEHEAEEGESARTPLIALTGVTLFLAGILALMLAITMTLYFVYGGR